MGQRKTIRSQLQAWAVEQHGLVRAQDADRLGMPRKALKKLVAKGTLTTVQGGLYRLGGMPADRTRQYAEAVLMVGRGAFLCHTSVLALHELIEQPPDDRIRVGVTGRVRPGPWPEQLLALRLDLTAEDLTTYRGIRSSTVARALLDSRDLLTRQAVDDAARQAVRQGLLLRRERHAVLELLDDSHRRPEPTHA